ncbi:hypothetical protein [Solihabitans fulvus]|uniref:hypothetical protein n=1 Tax=Solihabitans fulvus TaxID=1892852 RepID=UPI001CB768C4|nr:hypothetical protein [Solihabitans fulvus]
MRRRLPLALALPAAVALVALTSAPAAFGVPTTTPVPSPVNPGQPPFSTPNGPQPLGHAVGDAGTGLTVVRLLPNSAITNSPALTPDQQKELPKQAGAEVGIGLASAQANSEAFQSFERSVAQSSPLGFAIQGKSPQSPGTLVQTALPDNPQPTTGGLNPPATPLDALLKVGLLNGSVHARWDDRTGPCVDTIADASTSLASVSVLNAIPSLPNIPDLSGLLTKDTPKLDASAKQSLIDGLKGLSAPLSQLGGLLSGTPDTGAKGSLLSLPNTLSARSVVKLVDIPGSVNKAVQSISTLQVASVQLLAGTPLELRIDVVSQPTLVVTSTGDEATSSISYTAPILRVSQGGKEIGTIDAANPKLDVPIGIPLPGELPELPKLPIVGDLLSSGQTIPAALKKLDIGVLRLQIAELNEKKAALTDPYNGFMLGATARLLDLQLLPTDALGLPNLPSALAQVSIGEQVGRAAAPKGGVVCGTGTSVVPPGGQQPPAAQGATPPLAYTNAAYQTIPIFWTGTAMLLSGVVLVAALPSRQRRPLLAAPTGHDVPDPREPAEPDDVPEPSTAVESMAAESAADQSTAAESTADQSTAAESTAAESVADQSTAAESTADQSTAGESVAAESAAGDDSGHVEGPKADQDKD